MVGKTFGISRFGSGSHIMAFVMAQQQQWRVEPHFHEAGGLSDLIEAVVQRRSDVFLWETMMLRSAVRSGKLREIGLLPTPWPCFQVAVTDAFLQAQRPAVQRLLHCLTATASAWQHAEIAVSDVMKKCDLTEDEARLWLSRVRFSPDGKVVESQLELVLETLKKLNLGSDSASIADLYESLS